MNFNKLNSLKKIRHIFKNNFFCKKNEMNRHSHRFLKDLQIIEASVQILSKRSETKLSMIPIPFLLIPNPGWTCFKTL